MTELSPDLATPQSTARPEAMADVPGVCEVSLTRAVVQYRSVHEADYPEGRIEDIGLALVLDGEFEPSHCFEEGFDFREADCPGCRGPEHCAMRELWQRLDDSIEAVLGTMTVADLASRQESLDGAEEG